MKGIKIMENNVELNNIELDNIGVNTPGTVGVDANTQQTQDDKSAWDIYTKKTHVIGEDVAMEIVEMISFSGVPVFAPTMSLALTAQGIFILIRLPVINARYPPPAPSIGV